MKGLWQRIWLYLRVTVLVLVIAFVVQFLLINTMGSGPVRARIVFWEHDGHNLGALLAAETDWQQAKARMESHPVTCGTAKSSPGPEQATATGSAADVWAGEGADDQEDGDRRTQERRDS